MRQRRKIGDDSFLIGGGMFRLLLVFTILCGLAGVAVGQDLKVISATWAPYNMMENGKATGIGTEIVRATLAKAGIQEEIAFYPWARAYKMAIEEPNIMVYTIIKLPERSASFKWIGPIVPVRSVLHKLRTRNDIVLHSLEDAKGFKIGTTRNAAGHQFLLRRGFEDNKHVFAQDSNEQSVRLLFDERVDIESSVEWNFMYEAKKAGFSYNQIEKAWVLFENEGYIAFSLSTPDEVVEQVRSAFEEVKKAGIIDEILEKYRKMYQ